MMKGFNVYLKAWSQSCQITLATITGTGNDSNDRRQGVKERSNFLMSAVTGIHIICHHTGVSVVDVPSLAYDTFNRKPCILFNEEVSINKANERFCYNGVHHFVNQTNSSKLAACNVRVNSRMKLESFAGSNSFPVIH